MKKKRVGVITYHNADNLGAVLQAYALQTVLDRECGARAEIIDYRCQLIEQGRYASSGSSLKTQVKRLPKAMYYAIKRAGFDRFRKKYLNRSKACTKETVAHCIADYDVVITGSDQVWNLECSGWDTSYFLDFVPEQISKCAYAASLGNCRFRPEEQEQIRDLLQRFQSISVREQSAAGYLQQMGIREPEVCPDPVVLLTAEQWQSIVPQRLYGGKYILVYQIQPDVNVRNYAEQYAKTHGYKIIDNKKSIEFILHNAPADFLSWIFHAECVFTNSFHGTMFSLLFQKPLGADIALVNSGVNDRVYEVLHACRGEASILREGWRPERMDADAELGRLREAGIAYLKRIVG